MYDRDLYASPMPSSETTASRDWRAQLPELQLQTWHDASMRESEKNRFGGFERQIEADVLQNLHRFGG